MRNFFISYNKADRTWAEWVAWELEEEGYTTILQAWDFRPSENFVIKMNQAIGESERTIAVLSPNYLNAVFTQPEWAAAFAQDPTNEKGVLLPVRVQECDLKGLFNQIIYIDLVGKNEQEAKKALLDGIQIGRAKPLTKPAFPGIMPRSVSEQPAFPGGNVRPQRPLREFFFGGLGLVFLILVISLILINFVFNPRSESPSAKVLPSPIRTDISISTPTLQPSGTPSPTESPSPTPKSTPASTPTPELSTPLSERDFVGTILKNSYRRAFSIGFETRFAETDDFPEVRRSINDCYTNLKSQYIEAVVRYPKLAKPVHSLLQHVEAMDSMLKAMERAANQPLPDNSNYLPRRLDGTGPPELTKSFKSLEDHRVAFIRDMKALASQFNIPLEDVPMTEIKTNPSSSSSDEIK